GLEAPGGRDAMQFIQWVRGKTFEPPCNKGWHGKGCIPITRGFGASQNSARKQRMRQRHQGRKGLRLVPQPLREAQSRRLSSRVSGERGKQISQRRVARSRQRQRDNKNFSARESKLPSQPRKASARRVVIAKRHLRFANALIEISRPGVLREE